MGFRKRIMCLLACAALLQPVLAEPVVVPVPVTPPASPTTIEVPLTLLSTTPITSGAVRKVYRYEGAEVQVIEADLTNPFLEIQALSPQGQVASRATVSAIVDQQGAVAGINADFFNINGEGAPLGTMMRQGALITSPVKLNAIYSLGITTGRLARIEQFAFSGTVTSPTGSAFPLAGINKTPYYEEPNGVHSHVNQLHLYTEHWKRNQRGHDTLTTPTEVLVLGGVVQSLHIGTYYPGTVPPGAVILRGHGTAAKFLEANAIVGQPLAIDYRLAPEDQWQMIIGGHGLLVDQGQPVVYGRSLSSAASSVARSAVGISQDGKTVYLVAVARNSTSKGLTIKQLSAMLPRLGIYKGLNMDGGGSTAMAARPLGETETELVFQTQESSERPIVNVLGLFSTAPVGVPAGGVLSGPTEVLVGQPVTFAIKAYDNYFNPIGTSAVPTSWSSAVGLGSFDQGVFTATQIGQEVVVAQMDALRLETPVRIIGRDDIKSMAIKDLGNPTGALGPNQRQLAVAIETRDGKRLEVSNAAFTWTLEGLQGNVSKDGVLELAQLQPGGSITVSYLGFKATLSIQESGDQTLLSLQNLKGILFQKSPSSVLGFVDVIADPLDSQRNVVRLAYDFTLSTGTQAAYMALPDKGVALPHGTERFKISAYGQAGGEWLRAEFVDGKGNTQRLTLAQKVDWMGWQQLDLSIKDLPSPITLKRIYAVGLETDWKLTSRQGSVLFKDIVVKAPLAAPGVSVAREPLTLTVGSKQMLKGAIAMTMDTAPVTLQGRTLVPLRFVSEALGGRVTWHPDTKNAAIWQQNKWVDLWHNVGYMVRSGKRLELDVPPSVIGGRLMIPLRAVAESLDVKVTWEASTKQIILQ